MFKHNLLRWGLAVAICLGLAMIGVISGYAQLPDNDDFDSPKVITSLPYSDTMDASDATIADDDPRPSCLYYSMGTTVWYAFTPADDLLVEISTAGSNYDTILAIYTGTRGSLTEEACHMYRDAWRANLSAGETYFFMVGSSYYYYDPNPPPNGYRLTLSISEVLPPGNDSFADATVITGLPFEERVDTTAATLETGEPIPSCAYGPFEASVWYTFTPSESGPISALMPEYYYFEPVMAVYTGTSLTQLTALNCGRGWDGRMTIYGEADTTYYYQVGGMWGGRGGGAFRLEVTPPPEVWFYFEPGDPSAFDSVQFWGNYYDPGNVGVSSAIWDFGDGSTGEDCCPSHRFAADGDYTVSLTVTTYDGRSASTSQVVPVRTHDVAITRVAAPKAASAGQTRQISVYIRNYHYPEQVIVHLYKSVPGGYAWVGDLSQQVPVRHGTRTTRFDFSYTFTMDDARLGKVTFKAVAEVLTGRDALPADNEAISPPTKVNR